MTRGTRGPDVECPAEHLGGAITDAQRVERRVVEGCHSGHIDDDARSVWAVHGSENRME